MPSTLCAALGLGVAWLGWAALGSLPVYATSLEARVAQAAPARPIAMHATGRVAHAGLSKARQVHPGEVLLQLDDNEVQTRLQEARAELQRLMRQREAAVVEIDREEQGLLHALRHGARGTVAAQRRLSHAHQALRAAREPAPRTSPDRALTLDASRLLQAQAQLAAADEALAHQRQLQSAAQARGLARVADRTRALSQLDDALARSGDQLAQLERLLEAHRVRAPAAGRLGDVATLVERASLSAGTQVARVQTSGMYALLARFARPALGAAIRPGQRAYFHPDRDIPGASILPARVESTSVDHRGWVRSVLALSSATQPGIHIGLTGRVVLEIGAASPLRVALSALGVADLQP